MHRTIDILSITSEKLKKGKYKSVLPEYYALKSVTENNPWHLRQKVFDHVVAVFAGLEKVLELNFLKTNTRNKIQNHLGKKVGKFTRKELLIVATLLHDIAKNKAVITDPSGNTKSPGHEIIGSIIVEAFSSRFILDKRGEVFVKRIVQYHGFVNDILTLILDKKQKNFFRIFKEAVGDISLELLLFMYADILGSNLKKLSPKEFAVRLNLITNLLETG